MRRAVVYSFLAEFGAMASTIASFKIAADVWGAEGFGAWALTRRILSFLLPVMTCGLETALPRFAAMAGHDPRAIQASSFFAAGMIFVAGALLVASGVLLSFKAAVASVLFGSAHYQNFIWPLWVLMLGGGLYVPCYAYLRGRMKIMEANLVHVIMYGALPLVALAAYPDTPESALVALGSFSTLLAIVITARILRSDPVRLFPLGQVVYELVRYGTSRMYAALCLMGLATLPGVLAASLGDIKQAGFVIFGLTLVGLVGSAAAPISVSLLPIAANMSAQQRIHELRDPMRRLELAIAIASVLIIVVTWLAAPSVVSVFLGVTEPAAVSALRIAAFGAGPYAYFMCVRSVIDAHTSRGINMRNVMIAGAVFLTIVGTWAVSNSDVAPTHVVVSAYVVAIAALALLSARTTRSMLAVRVSEC